MIAVKGNVEYKISEAEKDSYIKSGFDILDDKGNKIADGAHKSVSIEKYRELEKKYEDLKATKEITNGETEEKLKEKVTELEANIESNKVEKQELEEQISNANALINELNSNLASKEEELRAKDKKIADLEKKLAK